jgi:hypothetical protein
MGFPVLFLSILLFSVRLSIFILKKYSYGEPVSITSRESHQLGQRHKNPAGQVNSPGDRTTLPDRLEDG